MIIFLFFLNILFIFSLKSIESIVFIKIFYLIEKKDSIS